ncbi:hypothetical protein QQZ08_003019 [Neonectria magnoliae]|uniref:Uncharacterized protein n=1 Tax=Neonectria magnoliae TaxID=2732573 RepID=A0ABR1IA99_9HYPO
MTCQGHRDMPNITLSPKPECGADGVNGVIVGYDPDPQGLATCPQVLVVQRTLEKILDVSRYDAQTYLWPGAGRRLWKGVDTSESKNNFAKVYPLLEYAEGIPDFFVSSVSNDSSIGVYRQHANCRGTAPFETRLSIPDLKIDVCVEGDSNATPWKRNRDKQEHSERLWLNASGTFDSSLSRPERQFTQKCESTSRRGWFELPSYHNDYVAGPLLDVWPSQEELKRDFNDYRQWYSDSGVYPSNNEADGRSDIRWALPDKPKYDTWQKGDVPTSGPLMTAAMAMFGNTSAFHSVATADRDMYNETLRQICEQIRLPFSRYEFALYDGISHPCQFYDRSDSPPGIRSVLEQHFARFSDGNALTMALEVAAYFANEAVLTATATEYDSYGGRPIYSSPGSRITKPKKSIPGLVVISLLIFL